MTFLFPAVPIGGSPVLPTRQIEIDFGAMPQAGGFFDITDPDVNAVSRILSQTALEPGTGKDADEIELEMCLVAVFGISNGAFSIFIRTIDGSYLEGKFKINYQVSF
jgi:hypothetical protein